MKHKKKTSYIILANTFPMNHPKAGQPTYFLDYIRNGKSKIHTIRANYDLWAMRFKEIEKDEACLSVRQWEGFPYRSKQIEIALLTRENGIGLQHLVFDKGNIYLPKVDGRSITPLQLSDNDGLSFMDWKNWLHKYIGQPLAVIHFTSFRY